MNYYNQLLIIPFSMNTLLQDAGCLAYATSERCVRVFAAPGHAHAHAQLHCVTGLPDLPTVTVTYGTSVLLFKMFFLSSLKPLSFVVSVCRTVSRPVRVRAACC